MDYFDWAEQLDMQEIAKIPAPITIACPWCLTPLERDDTDLCQVCDYREKGLV